MTTKAARFILATLTGVALLPGCTQTEPETMGAASLTARIAEEVPATRTSYDGYVGKFLWNEGDEIAVHLADVSATGRYETFKVLPNNPAETASVPISTTSTMTRNAYAVYPASAAVSAAYGSPTLKVNLPAEYDISDIVSGASAIKTADFSPCPMVAVNDPAAAPDRLDFYHVGGLLRITLKGVNATTQKVRVTFDEYVTGTFAVATPSAVPSASVEGPKITVPDESGRGKVVTFTLAETSIGAMLAAGNIVLNVPVPCVTFNCVTVETLDAAGETEASKTFDEKPLVFNRHHGKKLAFGELAIDFVLQHTGTTVALSDGTVVQEVVRDEDTSGATNTAPFNSYRTTDGGATKEDVSVTYEYAEADADGLPVRTGGDIVWSSAKPSTLSSVTASGSVAKTFSANVTAYSSGIVKETVSEFLKHAENLHSRAAVGSSASPRDLTMYDIHGSSRGGLPVTANSYVVDRAGWYMFPLVYGNAIDYTKSGASLYSNGVNAYAYKDAASPAANANNNWHNFQNFTGASLISTPYVLDDCGSLSPSNVEAVVVWQDVESATYSFIENVSVTNINSSGVFYDPKTSSYKSSVPYIKFQVPMGNIDTDETKDPLQRVTGIRQGNAVIAVRLKEAKTIGGTEYSAGTILWSWHIWITDGFDTDGDSKGDGLASIPVTNYQNVTLDMMPVNMGWCDTKTTTIYKDRVWYVRVSQTSGSAEPIVFRVVQKKAPAETGSSGTYYQWGRKDPFIPSTGSGNMNKAAYSPSGYTLIGSTSAVSYSDSPATNASTAIQNPHIHYHSSSTQAWMSSSVYPFNLWNMANGTGTGDVAVSKTVYDPCPPGYCVPRRNAFTGFTTTGSNTPVSTWNVEDRNGDGSISPADFEKGWYFYTNSSKVQTFFFPAAGYRQWGTSALLSVGRYGDYWSAAPGSKSNGYSLFFESIALTPLYNNLVRSNGLSVRPVQESHVGTGISAGGQQTTDYNFNGSNGQ